MENTVPSTGSNSELPKTVVTESTEKKYAGFWIRFLAIIIDSVLLSFIGSLFGATTYSGLSVSVSYTGWKALIPLAYVLIFWIWKGATPGKMVLGLKIIEEDGKKLTWQKAVVRYLSMFLSGIAFCLGFFWIGFNPKKQGWHDLLAKTYVIKTK
ncbi:MAG: RDD family protein [Candidatus Magasanikbacteria bacterium]